jgi:hypothetical protein
MESYTKFWYQEGDSFVIAYYNGNGSMITRTVPKIEVIGYPYYLPA